MNPTPTEVCNAYPSNYYYCALTMSVSTYIIMQKMC